MKLNPFPLLAFAAITALTSPSQAFLGAIFRGINDATNAGCEWNFKDPIDFAVAQHERLSTPLPEGFKRQIVPFLETDLRRKPWLSAYEYVIVVNTDSPYVHHTEFPQVLPFINIPIRFEGFGFPDITKTNSIVGDSERAAAAAFLQYYGPEADKVRRFGEVVRERNSRGQMVPVRSNVQESQTIRIYQRGQLIRKTQVSTGRGSFQLRGRKPHCEKPFESYHTYTEPGYYNFEVLARDYKSKSYDADMPHAMFYNRTRGLALHAAMPTKIGNLGTRDSGGCTRLDPNTAFDLFERILSTRGYPIPKLDVFGNPEYDTNGQLKLVQRNPSVSRSQMAPEEVRASYSALLIVQEGPVRDADPYYESAVSYKYQ